MSSRSRADDAAEPSQGRVRISSPCTLRCMEATCEPTPPTSATQRGSERRSGTAFKQRLSGCCPPVPVTSSRCTKTLATAELPTFRHSRRRMPASPFTENLATELDGTDVVVLAVHPGLVRTTITEHLARIDDGQRWVPQFSERAEHRWGDGASTIKLLDRIQRAATQTPSQVASSTSTMILPSLRPGRRRRRSSSSPDSEHRVRVRSWESPRACEAPA